MGPMAAQERDAVQEEGASSNRVAHDVECLMASCFFRSHEKGKRVPGMIDRELCP